MSSQDEYYASLSDNERYESIERMLIQIDQNVIDLTKKDKHDTWYRSCKNLIYLGIMEIDYAAHLPKELHLSSRFIQ